MFSNFEFLGQEPPTSLYESVINLSLFRTLTFSFDVPHFAPSTWNFNFDDNNTVDGLTWKEEKQKAQEKRKDISIRMHRSIE